MSVSSYTRNAPIGRPQQQDSHFTEPAPKLRSSCDNCHTAKVKCTPTASQNCVRCLSHNAACIYSPSLRLSKTTSTHASTNVSRRQSTSMLDTDADVGANQVTSARETRGISVLWDGAPQTLSDGGQSGSLSRENSGGQMDVDGMGDFEQMAQACGFMSSTPSTSSGIATTRTSSNSDYLPPLWPNESTLQSSRSESVDNPLLWSLGMSGKSRFSSPPLEEQELVVNGGRARLNKKTSMNAPNQSVENQSKNQTCDCHVRLLEALQISPEVSKVGRSKGPQTSTIAFDIILATNKRAIGRCVTMLGCGSCFGGSTSILLTTALLSQILALYHSACEVYLAHRPASKSSADQADEEKRQESIVPGPLRLNIGSYELEEEDEILLKKELMLIELRKVEGLLSRLRGAIGPVDDPSESGAYETLLAWLTRHLQRTVTVIQPRKGRAYDKH